MRAFPLTTARRGSRGNGSPRGPWILLVALLVVAASSQAQSPGEILEAYVLGVGGDPFQCGGGSLCNLRYSVYHFLAGQPEINRGTGMTGIPRYRPQRGAYATHATMSGNYPSVAGQFDIPFFVAWDGVLNPQGSGHVGYYGVQSQIVKHGEVGDSSKVNCGAGGKIGACFEPLSPESAHSLKIGIGPVGGLSPIPVPVLVSASATRVILSWEPARGMTITDGAPPGVQGYRLFAFRGRGPSDAALSGAALVHEAGAGETRAEISMDNPALARADEVIFVIKIVYAGGLQSAYFSANSDPVRLDGGEDGDEESEDEVTDGDGDGDLYRDFEDNCPEAANPGQEDTDGDGVGDACDREPGSPQGEAGATRPDAAAGGSATAAQLPPAAASGSGTGNSGPSGRADTDGDGRADGADLCNGIHDPEQADLDGDGVGDACDGDADGDGVWDDADCDPTDRGATVTLTEVDPDLILQLGEEGPTVLTWRWSAGSRFSVARGALPITDPMFYSHSCLVGGLPVGQAIDEDTPAAGEGFYYLVAAETGCGGAPPGRASDGSFRPPGNRCLETRIESSPAPGKGAAMWRLQALGGAGDRLFLKVILMPSPALADLYAVSLDLIFDPGRVEPEGLARPGPLLAERQAPLRMDAEAPGDAPGVLRLTVSRTGVSGGLARGGAGVLATLSWKALLHGPLPFRIARVRALNSSFAALPLKAPEGLFVVRVR